MDLFVLSSWIKFSLFIFPIWWAGTLVIRFLIDEVRFEVLYPLGLFAGTLFYLVLLNSLSFIFGPQISQYLSFFLVMLISITILKFSKLSKISYLRGKSLLLFLFSSLFFIIPLFWVIGKTLLGADVEIFYSIAKTFSRGNFPMVTPWQPDLFLTYHYGISILIGAINGLTNLKLDFILLALSLFYIFCLIQSFIWIWKRHDKIFSLLLYFLIPSLTLFSVGTMMLVIPSFPIELTKNLEILNLPTAHKSFETYGGAVVDLNGHVYFFHHLVGLVITWLLIVLCTNIQRKRFLFRVITVAICLIGFALINEAFFILSIFFVIASFIYFEIKQKSLKKDVIPLFLIGLVSLLIILFQGGVITGYILNRHKGLEQSVIIFPKISDYPEGLAAVDNLRGYRAGQQSTHIFKENFLFKSKWYQLGVSWLLGIFIILIIILWKYIDIKKKFTLLFFLSTSVFSILAYNTVIPIYVPANGNRFLTMCYQFLGLGLSTSVVFLFDLLLNKNASQSGGTVARFAAENTASQSQYSRPVSSLKIVNFT